MSFQTYITGIPAANNNPSNDQPNMLTNTNSIPVVLAVDHHAFNDNNGGYHKQVTFSEENIPGGAPVDPQSILFTAQASSLTQAVNPQTAQAQLFYKNSNGIFLSTSIRAMAAISFTPSLNNAFNISSVNASGGGTVFKFNLVANCVNGITYFPIWSTTTSQTITNISKTANDINFTFGSAPSASGIFSLVILQV